MKQVLLPLLMAVGCRPVEPLQPPQESVVAPDPLATDMRDTPVSGGSPPAAAATEAATTLVEPEFPPWREFSRVVRQAPWASPARASKRVWLDEDHRTAAAVMRTEQGEGHDASWRITLVRLRREGDAWIADGTAELETWTAHEELGRGGRIAVNLRAQDVDADAVPELVARFSLSWMCCGAGPTGRRTLVILNADARLSEAAYLHLDESIYFAETASRESFEDRDGDGHPDLVITWRSEVDGEPPESGETVHHWQAKRDRFKDARRPVGEDCYCE